MCRAKSVNQTTDPIEILKKSPMFNLSLSSKELFHSNFLYWLSLINRDAFKKLIQGLLNNNIELDWGEQWEVSREYKSFDLCVMDKSDESIDPCAELEQNNTKNRPKIYLVIENKVKSIPYKAQLDKYVGKVKEHYGKRGGKAAELVKYMLLTLPTFFPDAPIIDKNNNQNPLMGCWEVVTYSKYIEILKSIKGEFSREHSSYVGEIIDDYISFVENLLVLYQHWNDRCYNDLGFDSDRNDEIGKCIKAAENLRIHDLYHKSKYARICTEIINKVVGEVEKSNLKGKVQYAINWGDKKLFEAVEGNKNSVYVHWDYGYLHGAPLVGAKVAKFHEDKNIIYIIQVQSGVYEHGVIAKVKNGNNELWQYVENNLDANVFKVGNYPWMRYEEFDQDGKLSNITEVINGDIFEDNGALYPESKKRQDSLPYYKYESSNSQIAMIYQCRKLKTDVKTKALIDYLANDILELLKELTK